MADTSSIFVGIGTADTAHFQMAVTADLDAVIRVCDFQAEYTSSTLRHIVKVHK